MQQVMAEARRVQHKIFSDNNALIAVHRKLFLTDEEGKALLDFLIEQAGMTSFPARVTDASLVGVHMAFQEGRRDVLNELRRISRLEPEPPIKKYKGTRNARD